MFEVVFQGIILGLVLSILVGPVFILLVQTSMSHGIRSALILDIGILLSDGVCIFLAYLGTAEIFANPSYQKWIGIIGGLIFIGFGLVPFFQKQPKEGQTVVVEKANPMMLIFKGFILNITNPSVIIFWIGAVGLAVAQYGTGKVEVISYFSAALGTYFAFDILKAWLAKRSRKIIPLDKMQKVKKIASGFLIAFGIFLMIKFIFFAGHGLPIPD